MIKTKLIRISLISLLISITFTLILFDAIMPYKSVARGENILQELKIQWTQTYGGTENDVASSLLQTTDGGLALSGLTTSSGTGADMWLVKTDDNGVMQWDQTYGGINSDWATTLLQTTDGGFILAGTTDSFGAGWYDMWLVKTDENGVMQWNQTYGGTGNENAWALLRTAPDGGFALAGGTTSFGTGGDMWLVKTDVTGVMQWNQTYGGTGSDGASSLLQTTDGGFVLAGLTSSFGAGNSDMFLVKTDVNGGLQWTQTYGGTGNDWISTLLQTTDGGFALAGLTSSFGAGNSDMFLVKTDVNGVMQWNQTYGGAESDCANTLIQTSDGGFILAGNTRSYGDENDADMWLVKTDANGNVQWDQTYGGAESDIANTLIQTLDGGFILAGHTKSYGAGSDDMWVIKTMLIFTLENLIAGWIILVVALIALILVIKKQKRGS
ncbi:MAG: hypothetical protein ACXADY_07755 [Candidatus Hodarchaeales archaeon]|jgi:hypothetical protein